MYHQNQTASQAKPPKPAGRMRPRVAWLVTALVAVAVLLAVVGRQWLPQRGGDRQAELTRLTFDPGLQTDPALSPDGQFIAYASNKSGNFDIWVQPISGGDPIPVTKDPAHDWQPDWSPKGDRLVFRSEREGGGLMVVPAFGGTARTRFQGWLSSALVPGWHPGFCSLPEIRLVDGGITPHILTLDGTPSRALGVAELNPSTGPEHGDGTPSGGVTFLARTTAPDFTPRLSTVDPDRGTTIVSAVDDGVRQTFKEHQFDGRSGSAGVGPGRHGHLLRR